MEAFENALGYTFKDKELLKVSFTHSSYANEKSVASNERLEFLGDAVLEMASSLYLYERFPDLPEGELTKLRAAAVCEPSLARAARELGIGGRLVLGRGEASSGGRGRGSILADALEAVIGAVFLDGGFESARALVERLLAGYIGELYSTRGFSDYKSSLQEILQRGGHAFITYHLVGESGPDHDKTFTVEVRSGSGAMGRGTGKSKKEAEQRAALAALEALGETGGADNPV